MIKFAKTIIISLNFLFIVLTISSAKYAYNNFTADNNVLASECKIAMVDEGSNPDITIDEDMIPKPDKGFFAKYWDYILEGAIAIIGALGVGIAIGKKRRR